ncbi:hypothetical protein, partial [Microbacterium maritypicum]|uniref:hypothetical protein n=1 Tax=Microbacterium maritypicum TaxID=33918 RepID=UPI0038031D93
MADEDRCVVQTYGGLTVLFRDRALRGVEKYLARFTIASLLVGGMISTTAIPASAAAEAPVVITSPVDNDAFELGYAPTVSGTGEPGSEVV